ncbi:MAG: excinuclease ABC subunit UvrA [Lentisphaerae bacterium]|jgi:excinuclease ABC subunit A|nr:excinuclease ABC subunit UvrA [Lentisphaerota bacterium]MBT4821976.1 excinuclease ABC subunit UvrA [Lentisphaerota bacterium]MBT5612914.1 excinuclease ABC subunit UvrA [Lentisphaerota bacterium]MBT7061868.1 excinuclease ABC subunit UvrA [Lentisphaerota bacterium]MBT7846958.1 excinuclease ABC subunit UvrA [Lentisphaerota bacterium]
MPDEIRIVGARQHNLKNIDVTIPRDALVVVTGLSGSGKSSLAFDTLYAEGQRRYVESLSAYARQFLDRLQKPDVEHIEGLSPAIAIEQRSAGSNPRSIVATTTEIYDYLRLLYAHVGTPHCPKCGKTVQGQSAQAICEKISQLPEGTRLMLLAPYVVGKKGEHRDIIEGMQRDGFVRARVDGQIVSLEDEIKLAKTKKHTLEAVVDRLVSGKTSGSRLMDSVELALKLGEGVIVVLIQDDTAGDGWREETMSEHLACLECGVSFAELLPRNFSFNSPYGACPTCHGLGHHLVFIPELVVVNPSLSIRKGAIALWRRGPRRLIIYYNHLLRRLAEHYGFELTTPWQDLPKKVQHVLLHGSDEEEICFDFWRRGKMHSMTKPFEGILPNLLRRYRETESDAVRERLRACMGRELCPDCKGARLRPESLAVTVQGLSIHDFCSLPIDEAHDVAHGLDLTREQQAIAGEILKEIRLRLGFLHSVGLSYLSLNRESGTLSGGESQRIRLGTQVGSGLVGVLYVLDEPSIGLHQRDNERLLRTLEKLRDQGNTVVVVEHDIDTIRSADYVIDLGPGAGRLGGELVCSGPPSEISACEASLTGAYMTGRKAIPIPEERLPGNGHALKIVGASEHNLKTIDVTIPLGTFCCVTGVSGSGKSTLVDDILKKALTQHFEFKTDPPGKHKRINGLAHVDKMIVIDQSPIGRTPRSNPATYTDAFNTIRELYSKVPESRVRGYKPGRFSFNVKGGRCEECKGDGIKKIEMQFLPDVYVQCEVCNGKRYNRETLSIRYRGQTIADALDMTVNEACEVFSAVPRLKRKLDTLQSVGLGYIHLGQPATTLSGGEAQRVKLAAELARQPKGHTLYILDEPTTGLHTADIERLLQVLQSLRDQGNTVLVIEHNLDVIKVADHLVDLGPEGGDEGGQVVAAGTPEVVADCADSYTGQFLRPILDEEGRAKPPDRSRIKAAAAKATPTTRTIRKPRKGTAKKRTTKKTGKKRA